jgi:hypothetical protein
MAVIEHDAATRPADRVRQQARAPAPAARGAPHSEDAPEYRPLARTRSKGTQGEHGPARAAEPSDADAHAEH